MYRLDNGIFSAYTTIYPVPPEKKGPAVPPKDSFRLIQNGKVFRNTVTAFTEVNEEGYYKSLITLEGIEGTTCIGVQGDKIWVYDKEALDQTPNRENFLKLFGVNKEPITEKNLYQVNKVDNITNSSADLCVEPLLEQKIDKYRQSLGECLAFTKGAIIGGVAGLGGVVGGGVGAAVGAGVARVGVVGGIGGGVGAAVVGAGAVGAGAGLVGGVGAAVGGGVLGGLCLRAAYNGRLTDVVGGEITIKLQYSIDRVVTSYLNKIKKD
mgnify:CR=1 FL=1